MATSLTLGPAFTQFSAAPRPRPPRLLPQPIKPTRMTSLPAACTLVTEAKLVLKAAPATAVAEVLRKSRREEFEASFCGIGVVKGRSPSVDCRILWGQALHLIICNRSGEGCQEGWDEP